MKKFLSVLLAVLMLVGTSSIMASAKEEETPLRAAAASKAAALASAPSLSSFSLTLPIYGGSTLGAGTVTTFTYGGKSVYYDLISFSAKKGDKLYMLLAAEFKPVLQLLDSSKKVLTTLSSAKSDSGIYYVEGESATLPAAGTYYIRVTQNTKAKGQYILLAAAHTRSLAFSPNKVTLENGLTYGIVADGDYDYQNNLKIDPLFYDGMDDLSYTSSNTSVATVVIFGAGGGTAQVRAVGPGTAVITAKSTNGKTSTLTVTVTQKVTSLDIVQSSLSIYQSRYKDITVNIYPANATDKSVTYTSSNPSVAVYSNGTILGVGIGTATITATSNNNSSAKASIPVTVTALPAGYAQFTRLAGGNRYQTAVEISKAGWTSESDTVVLASGANFADALSGVTFAAEVEAPILLTAGKETLEADVQTRLTALNPKTIYILGGLSAVSGEIEDSLKAKEGVEVIRLSGGNRYQTSAAVANEIVKQNGDVKPDTAIIATGANFADALAVGPYAALHNYPVLFVNNQVTIDVAVKEYLSTGVSNIIIVGGTSSVSEAIVNEITGLGVSGPITRLAGGNRYETGIQIVEKYKAEFGNDICVATGVSFPDALAGGVFAASKGLPILLTGPNSSFTTEGFKSYVAAKNPSTVYIFGGESTVPTKVVAEVVDAGK
ncbi:MAG: cell wall-binding repeat-containing protein [Oscillospiraceae bacterium]|nr:cell wall-binding repeat-containing protein [Oscillospiraceae bacterium]